MLIESGCFFSIWKPAVDIWQKTQDGPSNECYLWNMEAFTLWIVCFKNVVQYNECLERTEEGVIGKLKSGDLLVAKAHSFLGSGSWQRSSSFQNNSGPFHLGPCYSHSWGAEHWLWRDSEHLQIFVLICLFGRHMMFLCFERPGRAEEFDLPVFQVEPRGLMYINDFCGLLTFPRKRLSFLCSGWHQWGEEAGLEDGESR